MKFVYNDGGRAEAGYIGDTRDCVCRAIAIAAQRPYKEVYDLINKYAKNERITKRNPKRSNARTGCRKETAQKILEHCGNTGLHLKITPYHPATDAAPRDKTDDDV